MLEISAPPNWAHEGPDEYVVVDKLVGAGGLVRIGAGP